MFEKFLGQYSFDGPRDYVLSSCDLSKNFDQFSENLSGASYNNGLYRTFSGGDVSEWNEKLKEAFLFLKSDIHCFGYDWLGRIFALDGSRVVQGEPQILLFEPGTGEALNIDSDIMAFHNEVLIEQADAALATNWFDEWSNNTSNSIKHNQCVGYKQPLFLGGIDETENVEVTNMEVYWDITLQLWTQVRGLPEGTVIDKITVDGKLPNDGLMGKIKGLFGRR